MSELSVSGDAGGESMPADHELPARSVAASSGAPSTSADEATADETEYPWMNEILNSDLTIGYGGPVTVNPADETGDETDAAVTALLPPVSASADTANFRGGTPLLRRLVPKSKKTRSAAAIGVVVAAVAAGVIVAVSSSHSAPYSASAGAVLAGQTATSGAAGRSVGNTPTAGASIPGPMPGAPSGPLKSGHTSTTSSGAKKPIKPTNPAQVKSWNSGQAGKAMAQVTTLAGTVLMAHGGGQYPQMLQACKTLAGAVQSAAALPQIPDAAMRDYYQKSLNAFKSGIAKCQSGITQHEEGVEDTVTQVNQADIQEALKRFGTGMTDLYIATDYLRKQ
jgi:hypothetical protein